MCHTDNELEAGLGNGLQKPCGLSLNLSTTGLGAFDLMKQVENVVKGIHDHCHCGQVASPPLVKQPFQLLSCEECSYSRFPEE